MNSHGEISGIPTIDANSIQTTSANYAFVVRAQSGGQVLDGQFVIRMIANAGIGPRWVTTGDLGTVPVAEYYSLPLVAESASNLPITYALISGRLPDGMHVVNSGALQGVPEFLNAVAVDQSVSYKFSIRATDSLQRIADRTFTITITDVTNPIIEPEYVKLGDIVDGSYYSQQLSVPEPSINIKISWKLIAGSLPAGVTLDNNGLISGYVQPLQLVGAFGPPNYDGYTPDPITGVITAQQPYSSAPYDFNSLNQSLAYDFTVQAYDGVNFASQRYVLNVISRTSLTSDTTQILNDLNIPINTRIDYYPVLLDKSLTLPVARQDSYYAYKFQGYDFQNENITYDIIETSGTFDAYVLNVDAGLEYVPFDSYSSSGVPTINLPGLSLDAQTGWLYGRVLPQSSSLTNYTFGVYVSKIKGGKTLSSNPVFFTLPVLGDINNTINWVSSADLGSINNGEVSELSIVAKSTENRTLIYSLVDEPGLPCHLPQGLTLLANGDISGRASFEYFSVDKDTTTFDNRALSMDQRYDFWARAETTDGSSQNTQLFTIHLNKTHKQPYADLYLRALPSRSQREIYDGIINDTEIFDPAIIYRPTDAYFGVRPNIRVLFMSGLNTQAISVYEQAMQHNHYLKKYDLGSVKTAAVLDDNFNIKYEVVYLEVNDPEETVSGQGPGLELDLTNVIANPHINSTGIATKVFYPNSTENMKLRIQTGVGSQNQSSLPAWMTSNQPGPAGTFRPPLGYVGAAVLAYTKPGGAELIAHRIQDRMAALDSIQFTSDRYEIDNFYSKNFIYGQGYIPGNQTTFDSSYKNVGLIAATVTWAVSVPFDAINSRSVNYINEFLCMDGRTDYATGDTVIFAKQENFPDSSNTGPYDGWINYADLYIGDNSLTSKIEGYDSEPYDRYKVIPGYLEKIQLTSTVNRRGGVWRINIVGDIVNLIFQQEIEVNDRVRVIKGNTYGSAILTYTNRNLIAGQSVPYYQLFTTSGTNIPKPTTFNDNTTRFFSHRDTYYTPESQDKYLKFTQYGAAD
jgi:hypothetical protein